MKSFILKDYFYIKKNTAICARTREHKLVSSTEDKPKFGLVDKGSKVLAAQQQALIITSLFFRRKIRMKTYLKLLKKFTRLVFRTDYIKFVDSLHKKTAILQCKRNKYFCSSSQVVTCAAACRSSFFVLNIGSPAGHAHIEQDTKNTMSDHNILSSENKKESIS